MVIQMDRYLNNWLQNLERSAQPSLPTINNEVTLFHLASIEESDITSTTELLRCSPRSIALGVRVQRAKWICNKAFI
jgi:hypothetical protein